MLIAVGRVIGNGLGGGVVAGLERPRPPHQPSAAAVDVAAGREEPLEVEEPDTALPIAVAGVAVGAAHLVGSTGPARLPPPTQVLAVVGIGGLRLFLRQPVRSEGADEGLVGPVAAAVDTPQLRGGATCQAQEAGRPQPTACQVDAVVVGALVVGVAVFRRAADRPTPAALAAQAAQAAKVRPLAPSEGVAVGEGEAACAGLGNARLAGSSTGQAGLSQGHTWRGQPSAQPQLDRFADGQAAVSAPRRPNRQRPSDAPRLLGRRPPEVATARP